MEFKAYSNPTNDHVPKVPGARRTVADQGAWLDKNTRAAPAVSWYVDVKSFEGVQRIAEQTQSAVYLLFPHPNNADARPTLHVDSRAEIDMQDGVPESIIEQHKAHPKMLFGLEMQNQNIGRGAGMSHEDMKTNLKVMALHEDMKANLKVMAFDEEGKRLGDEALARAGAELQRTAEERHKEHQTLADETMAKLMGARFVEDVRAVSTRTLLRTYLHEKDPKFAEAVEDRLSSLTALDAIDDGTLDAEVIKTIQWMKDCGVSQDRMFALLLRGLLCSMLQDRSLDPDGTV